MGVYAEKGVNLMGRKRKVRRQSHGSAWHWQQTDCWYYTMPGTRKRVALFDEDGQRIRGKGNKEAAEISLANEKLATPFKLTNRSREEVEEPAYFLDA